MFKKSLLLEHILNCTNQLKCEYGKKAATANLFMIALLRAIDAFASSTLPEEIQGVQTFAELISARDRLSKYSVDTVSTVNEIESFIKAEDYKSAIDEFLFGKLHYNAEARAKANGTDYIDVGIYLDLILAEPTSAIRRCITEKPTDSGDDARKQFADELDNLIAILRDTDTTDDTDTTEDVADATVATATKADSGADKLATIVKSTRDIRNTLLDSIFGQDQAVNAFISGYFQAQLMSCSRKEMKKPQATFLFAGPPGVGKTFLAEKAAEALKLPYMRFDMSEYSDNESSIEFCGSDKVYKNGKAGNVTSFVSDNPRCVLLFDEIEKAHINVIYLFLQILDAGRIRDNYTDQEVSFSDAVIIFTTNVGKNLYDDPSIVNLSSIPRKKILKALATDVDPMTGAPLFPAAICSRFASGNVVMFNHLEANNLYTIAKRELDSNVSAFMDTIGIKINIDDSVPAAIMFSEGGKADARTVKGRANAFFYEELYELLRLLSSGDSVEYTEHLKQINVTVPLSGVDTDIAEMFDNSSTPEVLVFADDDLSERCKRNIADVAICHTASSMNAAKEILFNNDISIVLCDISCGIFGDADNLLNAEDVSSSGQDLLLYVLEKYSLPVYIIQPEAGEISKEEMLSFAKRGVRGLITVSDECGEFSDTVAQKCKIAHQQMNMLKLAKENKSLSYKTAQTISADKTTANINLFDFRLGLITDTDDSGSVLDGVSRPNVHFDDVIGAEDAKDELRYFVEYLKNPLKYMRRGVRSPRGVLLYGPPGTGKTLLAKAMAGESGVTFMRAEGNEFLKKYVGEGAEAVHALFNAARKYAPAIVFIDEIDAIGKDRNTSSDSSATADVLTALLTEMDGFNTDTTRPVFVLAATNYDVDSSKGKSLDPALIRRFDRRIYIDLPNKDERKRYLMAKIAKYSSVELSEDQIDNIAMRSTGMSLAELESVIEMALRGVIRSDSGIVTDAEFEDAFETFNGGEARQWSRESLRRTAVHESSHALICWLSGEKPSYLTIVARGDHGGYMQHANSEDKAVYTKPELLDRIRTSLGGRAGEIVYYGTDDGISTGASADLYSATRTAERMICSYGMDRSVGMSYIDADKVANIDRSVRDRVNAILEQELDGAIRIIEANTVAIDKMVDALMEKNHLKEKEIDEIFNKYATFAVN